MSAVPRTVPDTPDYSISKSRFFGAKKDNSESPILISPILASKRDRPDDSEGVTLLQ